MIHTILEQFRSSAAEWFLPRADGHSALATMHPFSTVRYVPVSRLQNLSVLGAATALNLIHGMSAVPFDPVFLHYLVYGCDISSIQPNIVGEWHPALLLTISNWLAVGPSGDTRQFQEHFGSYHDFQVI